MSKNSNDGDLMVMNNYGGGGGDDDDDDSDGDEGKDGIMFNCTIKYSAPVSHLIYVRYTSCLYFCTVFIRCTCIYWVKQ